VSAVADAARRLHWAAGDLARGPWALEMTPEVAGWRWASLRLLTLGTGGSLAFATGAEEMLVVPLQGSCSVSCDGEELHLAGRSDVFSAPSDIAYVPRDAEVVLSSAAGGRFALAGAEARRRMPARHQPASEISVEARGAGDCSRRVVNYCMPDTFDADRLLVCEVITPSGNWSSYPPHKHDEEGPKETELEEIYYFELDDHGHDPGAAYLRLYGTGERPIELFGALGSGDVVAVPHGYHGPAMAPPGYDLYYLNVMAGPVRSWLASDDPTYAWVRETWKTEAVDPRVLAGTPGAPTQGAGGQR
jgi:5-deoxy-glucuronate isomerase